jgi:hypothetical protein
MIQVLMNLGQNVTIVYNLTTYEMFCSNKFVVSVKNLFDVAIKSQGHSDLIVICETPPCPNTYTKKI